MQLDLRVGQTLQQLLVEADMSDFISGGRPKGSKRNLNFQGATWHQFLVFLVFMWFLRLQQVLDVSKFLWVLFYILHVMLLTRLLGPHIIFVAKMQ
jgi:hypothetical protein